MPEICRFLGVVIYMLYDDHRPPHFMRSTASTESPWKSTRESWKESPPPCTECGS